MLFPVNFSFKQKLKKNLYKPQSGMKSFLYITKFHNKFNTQN